MNIPENEYDPYFKNYISKVADTDDLVEALKSNLSEVKDFINGLPYGKAMHKYQPEKWCIAEVLGHMLDTERIMAYRALRISRGDQTPIAGFEENDYIASKIFEGRSFVSLSEEFTAIRHATISLFATLPTAAWERVGTASNKRISVRALASIIVGHSIHHMQVIQERYL